MALDFDHLLGLHTGDRKDFLPICDIDPLVCAAIGATTRTVFLSPHTIQKQIEHHKEMAISAYRVLRPSLVFGEYRQDSPRTAVVLFVDTILTGLYYRSYVKATQDGREIFVTSFLPVRSRGYRAELRKNFPIIRPHLDI